MYIPISCINDFEDWYVREIKNSEENQKIKKEREEQDKEQQEYKDQDPGNGDFRLSPGSLCIDAGHNWAIAGISDTDLDGNPRFAADENDFDPGCGVPAVVDMGAYEYQGDPFPVKLGDIDGGVSITDFLTLLRTGPSACRDRGWGFESLLAWSNQCGER